MKRIFTFFILFLTIGSLSAQEVTYTKDIAPIIYTHCGSCHRDGEIGPMKLTNYDEVKSWGETIQAVTTSGYMPPWKADPSYSKFLGENYLTDEQIATIASWVENGMPKGNDADEPDFPVFPEGSVLGEPDLVLEMSEPFLHKGNFEDNYRYFVLPSGLTEDRIVKAIEFRPGNKKIVHHALVFEDLTGEAAKKDAATPEYGFDGFGSFTDGNQLSILDQKQFPGYVPGQKPIFYPDGTGQVMKAGSDVVVQIHYAPWPVDEYDQSTLNIFFADEDEEIIEREIDGHIMVPLPNVINDWFLIPAGSTPTFHGQYTVPEKVSLVGLAPHMHLLGKSWEIYLQQPDSTIVNLIQINDWDFNWQGSFSFDRYIVAEQGAIIHAIAKYDNTSSNPNNPSNPPQFVTWGEGTTDEMYYLPINFVAYRSGDEDIRFGSDTTSNPEIEQGIAENQILNIYPNPVKDYTTVSFYLKQGKPVDIDIYDMSGRRIRSLRRQEFFNTGVNTVGFATNHYESGMYLFTIQGEGVNISKTFVK